MAVNTAKFSLSLIVAEQLTANVALAAAAQAVITHTLQASGTLTSSTTVPVTKVSAQEIALIAGAKTLDLTALLGANGAAVDATGLKLQLLYIKNKDANANSMAFTFGASNGWVGLGSGWKFTLAPKNECLFKLDDASTDVASNAKNIDVTGTVTQAFQYIAVFG